MKNDATIGGGYRTVTLAEYAVLYLGRLFGSLIRMRHLSLAEKLFACVKAPVLLTRRFYDGIIVLDVLRASPQKLIWLQGERFMEERQLLEGVLAPGMKVIDVGANIGYYALMFSHHTGADGEVLCVEPDPQNLAELERNISANQLGDKVKILPMAAGDRDGTVCFQPGLNSVVSEDGGHTVVVTRIDAMSVSQVDLIKIDVEGYEGAVLRGGAGVIERFRPVIFLELHPRLLTSDSHQSILDFLTGFYSQISCYQMKQAGGIQRVLQNYGLVCPFEPVADLKEVIAGFQSGTACAPVWIVARR